MANLTSNFAIGADFALVNQTSFAGASTTDILGIAGDTGVAVKATYMIK